MVSGCLTIRAYRVEGNFTGSAEDTVEHLSFVGKDSAKHLSLHASLVCSVYIGSFSTDFNNDFD